jgi:hypothetical protein
MEESEGVFRKLGLPGFITVMDAVHMAYDRAPFPARVDMYAHHTPHIIHIHIQERGWDSIGVMDSDWQDKGPATGATFLLPSLLPSFLASVITRHGICFPGDGLRTNSPYLSASRNL